MKRMPSWLAFFFPKAYQRECEREIEVQLSTFKLIQEQHEQQLQSDLRVADYINKQHEVNKDHDCEEKGHLWFYPVGAPTDFRVCTACKKSEDNN